MFRTITLQDVNVLLRRATQVFGVKVSLLIKDLGMVNNEAISPIATGLDLHPTDQVLPEIQNPVALGCGDYFFSCEGFLFSDGFIVCGHEVFKTMVFNNSRRPLTVVKARVFPTRNVLARINGFPIINL